MKIPVKCTDVIPNVLQWFIGWFVYGGDSIYDIHIPLKWLVIITKPIYPQF